MTTPPLIEPPPLWLIALLILLGLAAVLEPLADRPPRRHWALGTRIIEALDE